MLSAGSKDAAVVITLNPGAVHRADQISEERIIRRGTGRNLRSAVRPACSSLAYLKVVFPSCNRDQSKQTEAPLILRYGPELLWLIESPEFRAHFDLGAGPIATKRLEP